MAAAVDSRLGVAVPKRKTVPHDLIRNQLNTLLENEILYKKQIQALEKDSIELTKAYDAVYDENKTLRSLVEHGPDTARIAQLSEENGKLRKDNQRMAGENKTLKSKIKGLEKELNQPLDDEISRQWKEAVEDGRKRREKLEEAMKKARTIKPVKDGNVVRSSLLRELEEEQEMSLRIDTLEKEIQVLQNMVKKMKMEWDHISFSRAKDKGSMTRNEAVANAINEKLTRDIYRFELRLNKLKKKHTTMISEQDEMVKRNPLPSLDEEKTDSLREEELLDEQKMQPKPAKSSKTKKKLTGTVTKSRLPQLTASQVRAKPIKVPPFGTKLPEIESIPSSSEGHERNSNTTGQSLAPPADSIVDHIQTGSPAEGSSGKPLELSILTRQELAEQKAVTRRQKKDELEAKRVLQPLPTQPYRRPRKPRGQGVIPRSKYLQPKQRAALYRYSLGRSLDDLSDDQTGSPIPIEFKEMDKFAQNEHVRLVLKRWDRPVYEPIEAL